jgi:predicted nucleic acid-binding protein
VTQIVSNSSPLISLGTGGLLHLLQELVDEVAIPERVWQEVVLDAPERPAASDLRDAGWVRVMQVTDVAYVQRLCAEIDPGESEAIALARQLGIPILLDERRGREVARREGVPVIGTGGALLRLKERGVVPAITPCMLQLLAAGWRASPALLAELYRLAGESNPEP